MRKHVLARHVDVVEYVKNFDSHGMINDLPYDSLHISSEGIWVNVMCNLLTFIQAGCVYDFLCWK